MRGEQACQQRGVEMLALLTKKTPQQQGAPESLLLATVKETINYQDYSSRKEQPISQRYQSPLRDVCFCKHPAHDWNGRAGRVVLFENLVMG